MNILIIGRRGLGKSTLAVAKANELNANQIYFDPSSQFHNVTFRSSNIDEFFEKFDSWPDDERYVISFVVPHGTDVAAQWNLWASRLWEYMGQHEGGASFVLIVDESHRMQSPYKIDNMLDEFIRRSPRRERGDKNPVDIIQTTHYPQDLNRVSWGESDVIFLFNVFHKNARKAIEDQFGEQVASEVEELRTPKTGGRDVIEIDSETGNYIVLDNEAEWYYDIRRSPKVDIVPGVRAATPEEMDAKYGRF